MNEATLGINHWGIVQRHDDRSTTILRPDRKGRPGLEIEVPEEMANRYSLATGDVVEGATEPIEAEGEPAREEPHADDWDDGQPDNPPEYSAYALDLGLASLLPAERLASVERINGLPVEEAEERPVARTRRSPTERVSPDRWLKLSTGSGDDTAEIIDRVAPLGAGCFGIVRGAHGSGMTRVLRAVLNGITANAPDCVTIVLLLQARGEEVTDWRRRFPKADVVVCPSLSTGGTPRLALRVADLVLEAAQRQTELGRDVVLLVDSLTALWGAMLQVEEADAQRQADQSRARQRMREWVQRAGCFHGEMPLGGSLGGSLTILGTVWHQSVDEEAEEEGELHPHLRLLEHITSDVNWRVVLSDELARKRLYPAIDEQESRSYVEVGESKVESLESRGHTGRIRPDLLPLFLDEEE